MRASGRPRSRVSGLPVADLDFRSEAEISTATPRRPAGEFSVLSALAANARAASPPATRRGKLMSNAESKQRHLDDMNHDVAEESEDEYGEDEFDDDFEDDFEDIDQDDAGDVKAVTTTNLHSGYGRQAPVRSVVKHRVVEGGNGAITSRFRSPSNQSINSNTAKQNHSGTNEWLVQRVYVPKKVISPEQRESMARQAQRVKNILGDIELTFESFDLVHRDPEPPMQTHLKALTRGKIREASTQYNDDWRSVKVQTETPKTSCIGTQQPDYKGSMLTEASAARLPDFVFRASQLVETLIMEKNRGIGFWSISDSSSQIQAGPPRSPLTEDSLSLALPESLSDRSVTCIHFSESEPNLLLAAYSPATVNEKLPLSKDSSTKGPRLRVLTALEWEKEMLPKKALLCLWHLNQPETPSKIMYCDGTVLSCGLSKRGYIAFGGMKEGSVALWDLREKPILHRTISIPGLGSCILRHPSFSTDNLIGQNHSYAIRKVITLPQITSSSSSTTDTNTFGNVRAKTFANEKTGFQIVSVDESGGTKIWTVIELLQGDVAGSETEFGLNLGSIVKLIKSDDVISNVTLYDHGAADLQCNPQDPGEFFIALNSGVVNRCRRYGSQPSPSSYFTLNETAFEQEFQHDEKSDTWGFEWELAFHSADRVPKKKKALIMSVEGPLRGKNSQQTQRISLSALPSCALRDSCTCMSISPFFPDYFITAYESGQVCLYNMSLSYPIKTWTPFGNGRVVNLRWSTFRPSVFFSLDAAGSLYAFDLACDDQSPQTLANLEDARSGGGGATMFDMSCNPKESSTRIIARPTLAYADKKSSTISIRGIHGYYTTAKGNELENSILSCLG